MSVKTQYRHIAYCQHLCLNSLLGDSLQVGVTFEVSEEAACVVATVPFDVARSSYLLLSGVRKDPSKPIDIDAIFKALKSPTGHPQVKGFQNNRVNGKAQHQIFLQKDQIGRLKCLLEMQGDVPFVLALKDFFDSLQQVDIEQLKGSSRKPLESRDVQSARANPRRPIRPRNGSAPQIAQADEHQSKPEAESNTPGSSMIKSESLVDLNASETAREDLLREQGLHGIEMGALLQECPDDPHSSDLVSELSPLIDPEDLLCEWSPLFDRPASTKSSPAAAELAFRGQEPETLVLRLDNEEYEVYEELSLTSLDDSFCFEPEDYPHPNQKRQRRE